MNKLLILTISVLLHMIIIGSLTLPSALKNTSKVVFLRFNQVEKSPEIEKIPLVQESEKQRTDLVKRESEKTREDTKKIDDAETELSESSKSDNSNGMSFLIDGDNVSIQNGSDDISPGNENGSSVEKGSEDDTSLKQSIDLEAVRNAYYQSILQKIESNKKYPIAARRRSLSADIEVSFTVHSDGSISNLQVAGSTNSDLFKNAAIAAIKKSIPFPPIPGELQVNSLELSVNIKFELNR